jgi:hypothetical protein
MGTLEREFVALTDNSVDDAWSALCTQLEATASNIAAKFAQTGQPHLSFTEVHDLAQLVDLAEEGLPLDTRLVYFATQCLMQVAERAVLTRYRPNYFREYRCLSAFWEASAGRTREPVPEDYEAHPAS